jgi:uncharacterized protein (DUF58 family)
MIKEDTFSTASARSGLTPRARIRVHSWSWVVVSVVLAGLQLFWPSRAWTTLLIILGGTWLVAFLWTLILSRGLSIQREMRFGWAQVGDALQERYTLYNDGPLPAPWLEVRDHSNIPDYQTGRVTSVHGREILGWRTEGICTRRGLYSLGPTSVRSGDPLGLCSLEIHQPDSAILLVLPPVLPLSVIEIAAGGLAGEGHFLRRTALETTVSVETVREYVHGDPMRAIHWPTSARRNALFVRQFDHNPTADWWIFLDLEGRVQGGSGSKSTEEHSIILAASLADRGIHQGIKVGLVTHGEGLTWLPPQRSSGQLMDIMRALAVVHPGERPLADLLTQARHSIRRGASLIVITPNVEAGWIAPLFQLVDNGIAPTVLLLDPASYGSTVSIKGVDGVLTDRGISHALIPPELFDRPEAHPGRQGRWEWEVVGPGKVVPVHRPARTNWRRLG